MRFGRRDLLWLKLFAAVLAAWWVDRARLAKENSAWRSNPMKAVLEFVNRE